MSGFDSRTQPEETLTFYVYDNLRSMQDHEGGSIYRVDTAKEAVAIYRLITSEHPHWTTALGGSINGTQELDFIQHRRDEDVLITDFKGMDFWRESPEVQQSLGELVEGLQVSWQVDHELTGQSILVPFEPEDAYLESYFNNMIINPDDPCDLKTGIQEVFAMGVGWASREDFPRLAKNVGYQKPEWPRVTAFNVSYVTPDNRYGLVDMSPSDLRCLNQITREAQASHALDFAVKHPEARQDNLSVKDLIARAQAQASLHNEQRTAPTKSSPQLEL